jgi:ligand-binding sensor domain-containing protein
MFRTSWLVLACACLHPAMAWAVDPARLISQYSHTAWRVQDGFFRGSPYTFVQTEDGYLWIGTDSGVVRFDGVSFLPWNSDQDGELPNNEVMQLLAARDGSLWIATLGGLSRWRERQLTNYSVGPGGATAMLEDRRGTIWIGRRFADAGGQVLCQWAEPVPRCLGPADGVPSLGSVQALVEDRAGNLWIGGDTTLLRRSANSYTAYRPTGLQNNAGIAGIAAIAEAPDGTLWVGISKPGPDLGLQRLVDGRLEAFRTSQLDGSTLSVSALYLDREGSLWIGTLDRGLYRVRGDAVAHFDRRDGLSGDFVVEVTEDREGSIWVATSQGVDRFSDTPVVSFSSGEGLCSPEAASVLATRDGSIWTGGDGALTRVRGSTVSCLRSGRELPGSQVTSLFADRAGRLWVGLDDGLWVYEQERFRQVRRPDGRAIGLVTSIAEAANGQVWIAVSGPPRILVRICHVAWPPTRPAACGSGCWPAIWRDCTTARYRRFGSRTTTARFSISCCLWLMGRCSPLPVTG